MSTFAHGYATRVFGRIDLDEDSEWLRDEDVLDEATRCAAGVQQNEKSFMLVNLQGCGDEVESLDLQATSTTGLFQTAHYNTVVKTAYDSASRVAAVSAVYSRIGDSFGAQTAESVASSKPSALEKHDKCVMHAYSDNPTACLEHGTARGAPWTRGCGRSLAKASPDARPPRLS